MGKASDTDSAATFFLVPLSSWGAPEFILKGKGKKDPPKDAVIRKSLDKLYRDLKRKKIDVSRLTSIQLLRRDFKSYVSSNGYTYGLSSVPISIRDWSARKGRSEGIFAGVKEMMMEEKLDAMGILTSGKSKRATGRQILLAIDPTATDLVGIFDSMKRDGRLKLVAENCIAESHSEAPGLMIRAWGMDSAANRKVVEPALRHAIEGQRAGKFKDA